MLYQVRSLLGKEEMTDEEVREMIIEEVFKDIRCNEYSFQQLGMLIQRIFYRTRSRLGILQPLMEDEKVSEIMANGPRDIFVERMGKIEKSKFFFGSAEEMEDVMRNVAAFVHREFNEMNPIVDARLKDGSRVNCVHKNIALNGPVITIRKFSEQYMTMKDLIDGGTVTAEAADLLFCLVACGYNIFVSGGTSTRQDHIS